MNRETTGMKKRGWLAAVMGLVMPGMGQAVNGKLVKGACFFVIFLSLYVIGFRCTVMLPDRFIMFGAALTIALSLAVYLYAAVDACRCAEKSGIPFGGGSYNRWYFYLAAWLLGSVIITGAVYAHVKDSCLEPFKIPSASMEPAVLRGDRVLADKTAYDRMPPRKGDIVIFVYPDDRSKRFIKRIEALPGETVTRSDGSKVEVPHGSVFVAGDNRQGSLDSRTFGFVPLADVVAKVRQVYFSSWDGVVRWKRIGLTL